MDENPLKLSCIMVLRLKYDGQGEEIIKAFPGVSTTIPRTYHPLTVSRLTFLLLPISEL